ncbi:hypothetical protein GCM10027341_41170 [Spirosoma knui]
MYQSVHESVMGKTDKTMLLTFGQYHTLTAIVKPVTRQQLTREVPFDDLMISYCLAVLLGNNLIRVVHGPGVDQPYYQLTESGERCIQEYEQQNPALVIKGTDIPDTNTYFNEIC